MSDATSERPLAPLGRNEPCPCGSGKKYKRCHGVGAAPKITPPKAMEPVLDPGSMPPGMENIDPQMMLQVSQALQRLPRGQLQRFQAIMQKAMSGKDVSREAEEFEKTLPVEFQQMLGGLKMPTLPAANVLDESSAASQNMTEEEARAIIAQAAQEGKLSSDKAEELLKDSPPVESAEKGIRKLWKNLRKDGK